MRGGTGRVGETQGESQRRRRHQTAERKREENSVRARLSCLRAIITKALTCSNHKKKGTAYQNRKTATLAVMLSHNIKSEKDPLEILSKQQSILASNVYTVWNERRVSGVAQILLSEAEMLRVTAAAAACAAEQPHGPCWLHNAQHILQWLTLLYMETSSSGDTHMQPHQSNFNGPVIPLVKLSTQNWLAGLNTVVGTRLHFLCFWGIKKNCRFDLVAPSGLRYRKWWGTKTRGHNCKMALLFLFLYLSEFSCSQSIQHSERVVVSKSLSFFSRSH